MARRTVANSILFAEAAIRVAEGKRVMVPTKGSSMLPFIVGGKDSILLVQASSLAVGDIVLAQLSNSHYVAHRIIKIEGEQITLMGDGNVAGVEQCSTDQVIAKVAKIVGTNKEIDCNSPRHLRRARLWQRLLPLRRYILGIWRRTPFWPMR